MAFMDSTRGEESHFDRSHPQIVAVTQRNGQGDPIPISPRTIGASEVCDHKLRTVLPAQQGVLSRYRGILQNQIHILRSADARIPMEFVEFCLPIRAADQQASCFIDFRHFGELQTTNSSGSLIARTLGPLALTASLPPGMSSPMREIFRTSLALIAGFGLLLSAPTQAPAAHHEVAEAKSANPIVLIKTSKGTIEAELYRDKAPITVANFLEYVNSGFYNGTIFHRVIPSFMIQGGGFDTDLKKKPTQAPIKNEAANGLKNDIGTLAMARTGVVDSATAQFFINTKDNAFLNHKDTTQRGYGYAVFGKVIGGMNVVKSIEDVKTARTGVSEGQPVENVIIESITVKK